MFFFIHLVILEACKGKVSCLLSVLSVCVGVFVGGCLCVVVVGGCSGEGWMGEDAGGVFWGGKGLGLCFWLKIPWFEIFYFNFLYNY